jgi:formylmethanofuran dehydrogenase subunit D
MPGKRFVLSPGRTSKQGQQINIGKDTPEYLALVSTLTMHPDDMAELGVRDGSSVRVRTDQGEAVFQCKAGKIPRGMLFVPYGPPTCRLMGGDTDGTGMPTSKGWDAEVEPVEP